MANIQYLSIFLFKDASSFSSDDGFLKEINGFFEKYKDKFKHLYETFEKVKGLRVNIERLNVSSAVKFEAMRVGGPKFLYLNFNAKLYDDRDFIFSLSLKIKIKLFLFKLCIIHYVFYAGSSEQKNARRFSDEMNDATRIIRGILVTRTGPIGAELAKRLEKNQSVAHIQYCHGLDPVKAELFETYMHLFIKKVRTEPLMNGIARIRQEVDEKDIPFLGWHMISMVTDVLLKSTLKCFHLQRRPMGSLKGFNIVRILKHPYD